MKSTGYKKTQCTCNTLLINYNVTGLCNVCWAYNTSSSIENNKAGTVN